MNIGCVCRAEGEWGGDGKGGGTIIKESSKIQVRSVEKALNVCCMKQTVAQTKSTSLITDI